MPKYAHPDVLDQGPKYIQDNCTKMLLISGYVAGDSYATVVAAKLAEVDVVSGDFAITNNVNDRRLAGPSGKSANATVSSGASPDLHVAYTNGVDKVLWVTDETTNQVITSGNPVAFPQAQYNSAQPT